MARVAMMLDGGYVTKRHKSQHGAFPSPADVVSLCSSIKNQSFPTDDVYRLYFYDCDPFGGSATNPVSGAVINFSTTPTAVQYRSLIDGLEQSPNFAVRRGELVFRGWKLGGASLRGFSPGQPIPQITGGSFVPDIVQKGVDMRVGLDMAALALKKLADIVVLITGDADMIPAMRFARREGLRVYLHTMGFAGVRSELKAHADIVF